MSFFTKAKKVTGTKDTRLQDLIINSKLGEKNYFILHPEVVNAIKNDEDPIFINYHFNLGHGVACNTVKGAFDCTYDENCPVCQMDAHYSSFYPAIFDYIEEKYKIKDKKKDAPFFKTFDRYFGGLKSTNVLLKVLYISPKVLMDGDEMETKLLRVSGTLLNTIEKFCQENMDLFENGKILDKVIYLETNGKSGSDIRYKEMGFVSEKNKNIVGLIPDWTKINVQKDFGNFDLNSMISKSTQKEANDQIGEWKRFSSEQELIDTVEELMNNGGTTKETKDASSLFEQMSVDDIDITTQVEPPKTSVLEKIETISDNEETPEEIESSLDELANSLDEVEELIKEESPKEESPKEESSPKEEESPKELFVSVDAVEGFKPIEFKEFLQKIVDENVDLEKPFSDELYNKIKNGKENDIYSRGFCKEIKPEILKEMDGNNLYYVD